MKINGVKCRVSDGLVIDAICINNSNLIYTITKNIPIGWLTPEIIKLDIELLGLNPLSVKLFTKRVVVEFSHDTDVAQKYV